MECPLHGIDRELTAVRNEVECVEDARNQDRLNTGNSDDIQMGDEEIIENDNYDIFNANEIEDVHANESIYTDLN